jgi:hypothetical protein
MYSPGFSLSFSNCWGNVVGEVAKLRFEMYKEITSTNQEKSNDKTKERNKEIIVFNFI